MGQTNHKSSIVYEAMELKMKVGCDWKSLDYEIPTDSLFKTCKIDNPHNCYRMEDYRERQEEMSYS